MFVVIRFRVPVREQAAFESRLAAAVAVYALVLAAWLKATGQGLALSGFAVAAEVTPS